MKTIKHILAGLLCIILFLGCQKEYSIEGGSAGARAAGTLKDTSRNCLPIVVMGTYRQDSTLTDSNFVLVQVNISTAGIYKISAGPSNGFSFSDSGIVTTTGLKTFKLKGSGKPVVSSPTDFTVTFDTTSCTFPVTVLPAVTATPAAFTLAGAGGTCTAASVQGTYQASIPLTTANNVTLNVQVTTPGSYVITTAPAVNGMTFTGAGIFTTTGAQTVILQGSGTPTAAATNTIPVVAGGTTCSFSVTVGAAPAPAVYTLTGAPGNCTGAVVQGTYKVGTALTTSNTVTISVTVTTIGAYTISTSAVGGMTFAATGAFTTTGPQTVVLQGTGTPTTVGANTIPVTAGGSSCSFTITVMAASSGGGGATAADSAWSFNQGTTFNNGSVVDVYDTLDTGATFLVYEGEKYPTGDTAMTLSIKMTGSTIQTGNYTTAAGSSFVFYNANTLQFIYLADANLPGSNMTIVISTYNASTGAITGTFSGTAINTTTFAALSITNGKFKGTMR